MADPAPDFEGWARARQQALFRTAYLLCGNREGAEDLVQSTLVKMFRAWRSASRADNVDAYARKVLVRTFLDGQRRRRREISAHRLLDPALAADQTDLRVTMTAALAQVPPRARAVVVLRYWEDLSVEVTAAALGCSTGTVKSQSSRGLARLRELIGTTLDHPTGR